MCSGDSWQLRGAAVPVLAVSRVLCLTVCFDLASWPRTGYSRGGAAIMLSREPTSSSALTSFPLKSCVLRSVGPFRPSDYCLFTWRLFHDYNLSISCALSFFMGRWRLNVALKSKGNNTPRKRPPKSAHYIGRAQVTCQTAGGDVWKATVYTACSWKVQQCSTRMECTVNFSSYGQVYVNTSDCYVQHLIR